MRAASSTTASRWRADADPVISGGVSQKRPETASHLKAPIGRADDRQMTQIRRQAGLAAAVLLVFASSARADVVVPDNQEVQGNLCAGVTCAGGEPFGASDTAKLKSDDPGLLFDDTSAGGVADNDWALQANDLVSASNAFLLRDVTGSSTPFSVFHGAPTDSLRVAGNGNIGLGTDAPALDLSIRTNDTPAIRMEQSNLGGFTAQTWDIGANEANFFVRDVTSGSRLPFRIRPGALTSSIDIASNSNVGFGTASPAFPLDAVKSGVTGPMQRLANNGPSSLRFENTTSGSKWDVGGGATNFTVGPGGGTPALTVTPGGDATTGGVVQQSTATENPAAVDAADVLAKLRALAMTKSELTSDPANALHLSPAGADFRAAFGLGSSDGAIAPSDMAGVALVGVQALAARVDDLDTSRVGSLATRLDALEKAIAATSGQGGQIAQLVGFETAVDKRVTTLEKSNRAMAKHLTAIDKKLKRLAKKR
jgi:hypothetical protein